MIPLLLMLAAADAPAMTPIDAERAFAADAKTIGQWTAFRKWSTDDAVMFVPQPVNAHEFLKDRKDPPRVIDWWPTASYVSCDGSLAVNTGGWKRPDGSVGYFTTVWQRQPNGEWKWTIDSGGNLGTARGRPAKPVTKKASCGGPIPAPSFPIDPSDRFNHGGSPDNSLLWSWSIAGPNDERSLSVMMCTSDCRVGRGFVNVISDKTNSK